MSGKLKRIMVIGCGGSGKSTMSKKIHKITGLPLIHLDQYYWMKDWLAEEKEIWKKKNRDLCLKEKWIQDGNYGSTMEMRLKRADQIIFMDKPNYICLYRVFKRYFKYYGKVRSSMTEGCKERLTWEFIHYILVYNITRKKSILKNLKEYSKSAEVIILKDKSEEKKYLARLIKDQP